MKFKSKIQSNCTQFYELFDKKSSPNFPTPIFSGQLAGVPSVDFEITNKTDSAIEFEFSSEHILSEEAAKSFVDDLCVLLTCRHFNLDRYNNNHATLYFEQDKSYFISANLKSGFGYTSISASGDFPVKFEDLSQKCEPIHVFISDAMRQPNTDSAYLLLFFILEKIESSKPYENYQKELEKVYSTEMLEALTDTAKNVNPTFQFGRARKDLSKITILSRHEKLHDFLQKMGVHTISCNGSSTPLTVEMVNEIIEGRNKIAHGSISTRKERVQDYNQKLIPLVHALLDNAKAFNFLANII